VKLGYLLELITMIYTIDIYLIKEGLRYIYHILFHLSFIFSNRRGAVIKLTTIII